jgi:hypothetical protein
MSGPWEAYQQTSKPSGPWDAYATQSLDPTEGMGTFERVAAGAGKGMVDLYRGGKQLFNIGDQDALRREIEESRRLDAPLMKTGAGMVGNIIGQAAIAAPTAFIPGVNTLTGATLLGGAAGAFQPTLNQTENATNIALGGAGGAAGKKVADGVGRLLKGRSATVNVNAGGGQAGASSTVSGSATAKGTGGGYNFGTAGPDPSAGLNITRREAMDKGRKMGMRMTPGQASGSRVLQQFEAKLEAQPMTSGTFNAIKANNQTVMNRAAADAIGETSDVVDSSVLAQAHDRISDVYKFVADDTPRGIDPDSFITKLANVENEFEGLLPGSVLDNPLVKRLWGYAERGNATGRQLQDLASKLGKAANSQMTSANGDRQLGMALFQIKDQADEILSNSLKGETKKAFDTARGQYRNMMLLTQRNGIVNPSSGDVSGASLANLLQQKDKGGFLYGKNQTPLYNAARFSQAFKPIVGDSGTATRMPLPSPTDFVLSLPFNLATRAYTSSPVVNASAAFADGIAPNVGKAVDPYLQYLGMYGGGLLGANASK